MKQFHKPSWDDEHGYGFFCPTQEAVIHDDNYCKYVCERRGVRCEHLQNRKNLRYY
jgi:hypothetical protein